MNCEEFRSALDVMFDKAGRGNIGDLPEDMRSHLEKCPFCSEYFETALIVQQTLTDAPVEKIPAELYWRLIKIGKEQSSADRDSFVKQITLYILKILLPVLSLWIIALFISDSTLMVTEVLTVIYALVLMFEKTAKRLIIGRM